MVGTSFPTTLDLQRRARSERAASMLGTYVLPVTSPSWRMSGLRSYHSDQDGTMISGHAASLERPTRHRPSWFTGLARRVICDDGQGHPDLSGLPELRHFHKGHVDYVLSLRVHELQPERP